VPGRPASILNLQLCQQQHLGHSHLSNPWKFSSSDTLLYPDHTCRLSQPSKLGIRTNCSLLAVPQLLSYSSSSTEYQHGLTFLRISSRQGNNRRCPWNSYDACLIQVHTLGTSATASSGTVANSAWPPSQVNPSTGPEVLYTDFPCHGLEVGWTPTPAKSRPGMRGKVVLGQLPCVLSRSEGLYWRCSHLYNQLVFLQIRIRSRAKFEHRLSVLNSHAFLGK
jgi:hypothetical protein